MEVLLRLWIIFFIFWVLFALIILRKAFQDSFVQGLLCLFLPLYVYYYALFRLETERKWLLVGAFLICTFPGPLLGLLSSHFVSSKACTLITAEEIQEALGESIEARHQTQSLTPFGMIDSCNCKTVKEPSKTVVVALAEKCDSLDTVRKEATAELTKVPALGDEALWGGTELVARKGRTCIYVEVKDENFFNGMDRSARLGVAMAVAEKALARVE